MKKKPVTEMDEHDLIYTLLADKVGSVDPKDVFYSKVIESGKNAGKYSSILGGKKLSDNQLSQLQQEVGFLENTLIWKVFTNTLPHEAELRMFKGMKTLEDSHYGKAILHAVGVMEAIVRAIKNPMKEDTPLSTPPKKE